MGASAGGIRAGSAFVEMFLQDKLLRRGLDNLSRKLQSFGSSISSIGKGFAALGTAIVAPLVGASKVAADLGGQFKDMSDRTGVSIEALSTLGYAAEQSALSLGTVEGAFRKLNMFMDGAGRASGDARLTLSQLGIAYEDLAKSTPEDQFRLIIRQLSQIENKTTRSAFAMRVFGRAGYALGPLLEAGADGMAAMEERARKLGFELDTASVVAAEGFGDQLDDLTKQFKFLTAQVGMAVIPVLSELLENAVQYIGTIIKWVKENRVLIVTVLKLGGAILAAGTGLIVIGKAVSLVGVAIGTLSAGIGLLLTPIGLLVAGATALVGAYVYFGGKTAEVIEGVKSKFQQLLSFVSRIWQGIQDAISVGDWELAFQISWLTVKQLWTQGVAYLLSKWYDFRDTFLDVWTVATWALADVMFSAWKDLQIAWVKTVAFFESLWNRFINRTKNSWKNTKSGFASGMLQLEYSTGKIDKETYEKKMKDLLGKIREDNSPELQGQKAIEEQERERIAQIGGEREAGRKSLREERDREIEERSRARQRAKDADQEEVERAKQALQDAIAEAARKRAAAEEGASAAAKKQLNPLNSRVEVGGTFNALAVRGMSIGNSVQEQTLQATKDVAKNTKQLLKAVEDSDGAVFE